MHEYGLAEGVLATVRQRAAGRKVAGIRVRFGVKHAVDEESMAQAWGFVAEGTEAEGSAVARVAGALREAGAPTCWPSARAAAGRTSRSPAATR